MKKVHLIFFTLLLFSITLSCSEFSVKKDFQKHTEISELKKVAVVLRLSVGSKISKDEQDKNLATWLNMHESSKNISIITESSDSVSVYKTISERLFQSSIKYRKESYFGLFWNDNYLKYKALGSLNNYIRKNENELKDIISRNNLDSLAIYEIYNIVSVGMQFMDFETVVAFIDKNLNIIYLDHQSDNYEISEQIFERAKHQLMDKISERLTEEFKQLELIGELPEE